MFRVPVRSRIIQQKCWRRHKSSSSYIRSKFIEYFVKNHDHKYVKSSSVVPLCDPTVPFVNAGMNQFKAVFLGQVDAPCQRAVNSQKCIRVGGKHNDLDVVGTDGHHHTFFEMLGNWSFGDYYKKEACRMAWDLLLGPYRLKADNLVITYFSGDSAIGLQEDRDCSDIWKSIGVPSDKIKGLGVLDNFWEMGATGPCGPCTEIHYVNPDGSLTEIWNLVFIQFNREADGSITPLRRQHVDTGMGLERMATLMQGVPTNYDTDLFQPIIRAIYKSSSRGGGAGVLPYGGQYGASAHAALDRSYRQLADHARMFSIALADQVYPATSLNLKQIMRRSFKLCVEVFKSERLACELYDRVADSLGDAYPELVHNQRDAKVIIQHELHSYLRMKGSLSKKWRSLVREYPEVEMLSDVDLASFPLGYKELKEVMSKHQSTVIPGDLVFKLYDTHGFQEDLIDKVAKLNNLVIDKEHFHKLLTQHRARHKTSFKEQHSSRGLLFDKTIERLIQNGYKSTNDQYKYNYTVVNNKIDYKPLKTKVIAVLNEDCEWMDSIETFECKPYYLVTEDTNFYCEEGGQIADTGLINVNNDVEFKVDNVFKIRDFVFHKGYFKVNSDSENKLVYNSEVELKIDSVRRLNIMQNHTGVHLMNAAIKEVLPMSVVCPTGSRVTDRGFSLQLVVYGNKISQDVVLKAQQLIRNSISSDSQVTTRVVDSVELAKERQHVATVPGETYPETGLRVVQVAPPLHSIELCCGTHLPSTRLMQQLVVTLVKGAGGHSPTIHAVTGDTAQQALELFSRVQKLDQVINIIDPERLRQEASSIKQQLLEICGRGSGAPAGEYATCLAMLDSAQKKAVNNNVALFTLAEAEIQEAAEGAQDRQFVVHFLRCSYLMQGAEVTSALSAAAGHARRPALLLGCAGGVIAAVCLVPKEAVSSSFTAERWLRCVVPIFQAEVLPPRDTSSPLTYAEMTPTHASLITCEQLVQDAMRVAITFAQTHAPATDKPDADERGVINK